MKLFTFDFSRTIIFASVFVALVTGVANVCAQCTPPPSGVVGWWPGEGNANDFTGSNNAALSPGGASYAAGRVGQGFRFDGTNGFVLIPDANSLKPANVTVEAWVWLDPAINTATNSRSEQIIFKKNTWSAFFEGYSLVKESNDNGNGTYTDRFQFTVSRTGNQVILHSQTIAQRGVWYHVAGTYDGNISRLFVNGVQEATTTAGFALDYDTTPVYIGTSGTFAPYLSMFAGIIDEPTIYNRALGTNELAAIYAAGVAGKCTGTGTASNGVPVIASFAPLSATNSALVTIVGTNFSSLVASNLVRFGAVRANVLAATANTLLVAVPTGATLGSITVTVGGLTAASGKYFQPTFFGSGANISAATFASSFNLATGNGPLSPVISDLDGDGKSDLAWVNFYDNTLSFTRNLSTNGAVLGVAVFGPIQTLALPATGVVGNAYRVLASDLDGDGRPDLMVCEISANRVSLYHNVAAPGTLTTNSFAKPVSLISGSDCRLAAAADLDGDGRVDIVALNYGESTVSLFKNIGSYGILTNSSFAAPVKLPAPGGPYEVALADLDGDGRLDLAVAEADSNKANIFQNNTTNGTLDTNSFRASFELTAGGGTGAVAAGDVDGDGKMDVVLGSYQSGNVSVFRNVSAGGTLTTNSFAPVVEFYAGTKLHSVAVGDLNGDAKPDLTAVGELPDLFAVFQNASTPGSFTNSSLAARVDFGAGWNPANIAIGDLNGDGRPDVVFGLQYGGAIQFYQNVTPFGTNPPAPPTCTPVPSGVVGWWPGEGNAADVLGGNNGTIQGATNFATGEVSQSFSMNGASGAVRIPASASLNVGLAGGMTAEAWVYANNTSPQPIFEWSLDSNPNNYEVSFGRGHPFYPTCNLYYLIVDTNGIAHEMFSFGPINSGGFQHLAMTYDRATGVGRLFIDGQMVTESVLGTFTPKTMDNLYLGARPPGDPYSAVLNGRIDEAAVYNRALTTNEIAAIYHAGSAGKCFSPPLPPVVFVDGNSPGYYNAALGTVLDGTSAQFPIPYASGGGDPTFYPAAEPNLAPAAGILGNWFAPPPVLNSNWLAVATIPATWNLDSETAIVYQLNAGSNGVADLRGDFDVDNGIYVWVNGQFKFGACAPGLPSAAGQFEYTNVALGSLPPGTNYVQILREDNGISTGYQIRLTGAFATNAPPPPAAPVTLLNVDFDGGDVPQKVGFAAAGMTTNDFWNFYTRNDGAGGWRTFGSLTNLKNADSSVTAAGLTVANAPGSWGSSSTDYMYAGFIYPFDGGNVTVTITNLPDGIYDVLPYSPNGNFEVTSAGTNYGIRTTYENPVVNPPVWQPGVQYARFTNVTVTAGQPLVLTVHPGVGDNALLAGLQLALSSLTNALPPPPVAPFITAQPTNVSLLVGSVAAFSVTAQGSAPLSYQWRFNGTNLAGATAATLVLSNVSPVLAGNYSVLVANYAGSVVSSNAALSVLSPPFILAQTPSQIVLLSNAATFSVSAGGTAPLNYFWSRNNALIPGATNSSYTLVNAQLADSGSKFSCLVTNAYGFAASTNSALKVIDTIANDLCSGAVIIATTSYTNTQATLRASSFGDPSPGCVDGFGHGVWYQFTSPVAGLLIVDTFGSDFDTGLAVYAGDCGALTEVACNDDAGGVTSQVTFRTAAATTYFILAGGYGSAAGNLALHLNYFTPPVFDLQPTNLAVIVSSNGTFSAAVSGTSPITLQWYFNNAPLTDGGRISGVTNSILNLANVITNDGGNYFVVASNFVGVTTSSVAVLTPVILPPVFVVSPVAQSILTGSNVNFFAVMDGTPPYSYQWYFAAAALTDDGHFSGANTPSLTISNLTPADSDYYTLVVTNVSGSVTSAPVLLTVLVPPSITVNPLGRSVPPGLPTTFNATASGVPAPTLQWQLNGVEIPGATFANYTNAAVNLTNLGFYQIVASNFVGVVTSSVAQLTFGPVAAWGRNLNNESLPPPNLSNVVSVVGTYLAGFSVLADGGIARWGGGSATNIPASASNVVGVAITGSTANYAVRANGTVVSWNGISAPANLSNIVSVAAGNNFGIALRAEGALVGWGNVPYSTIPAGLGRVTAIAAAYSHSLALKADGTVVAWGTGNGTNVPASLSGVTAIAAGYAAGNSVSLALKSNGVVVAWGAGIGVNLPAGLTNIAAISASSYPGNEILCLAIRTNGRVVAWGDNVQGQITPPTALTNLFSVGVSAGTLHGFALVNDGAPQILQPPIGLTTFTGRDVTLPARAAGAMPLSYQWLLDGTNLVGATNLILSLPNIQLGNAGGYQLLVSNVLGTAISLIAPVTVIGNSPLVLLSSNTVSATNIYQGGTVKFTGGIVLGSGPLRYQWFSAPTNNLPYLAVAGATNDTLLLDPVFASQSGFYYLAISNLIGGITSAPVSIRVQFAKAWGYQVPTNVPVVTNAIAIATGGTTGPAIGQYFAVGADGKLTGWTNSISSSSFSPATFPSLSNAIVTAIAASYLHQLVLKSDGTVSVFGSGATNVPNNLNGVIAVAAGSTHDLALKSDGTIAGWLTPAAALQSNFGQATNHPAATNVVAVAAGYAHSLALRTDGTLVAWGYGGDGSITIPNGATNVIAIAAGGNGLGSGFSLALRGDGSVLQWGNGMASYPVPANLSNVVAISGASTHGTALKKDGTVVTWGYEYISLASNNIPADLTNVIALASGGDHDLALFGTRTPAFTVSPWSRTVPLLKSGSFGTTLAGKCSGVQPVTYQWRLNGTNVSGATNDTLVLRSIFPAQLPVGTYQLVASNSYGVAISKPAKVTLSIPLGDAVDATSLNWISASTPPWYGQTNVTHDNLDAARSGGIGGSGETILQTTLVTNVPGSVTFWWKISSEQFFDTLEFRVNGAVQASISGEVDWTQVSVPVAAGTNGLQWRYAKDFSFDAGLDAAFVDQFAFATTAAPFITVQPLSATANLGGIVTLSVAATGSSALHYQWRQNGTPVGSDSLELNLINVSRTNNGTYSVTVTNASGAAISSNALVRVNVPQLLGAPVLLPNGSLQFTSTDANGGALTIADLPNFEAQAATDLVTWTTLPDALSITNGMLQLNDATRTNFATRFYRIIEH